MPARCGMFYRGNEGAEWVYDAKKKRWSELDLRGQSALHLKMPL